MAVDDGGRGDYHQVHYGTSLGSWQYYWDMVRFVQCISVRSQCGASNNVNQLGKAPAETGTYLISAPPVFPFPLPQDPHDGPSPTQ